MPKHLTSDEYILQHFSGDSKRYQQAAGVAVREVVLYLSPYETRLRHHYRRSPRRRDDCHPAPRFWIFLAYIAYIAYGAAR